MKSAMFRLLSFIGLLIAMAFAPAVASAEGGFDPGSYVTTITGYGAAALLAGVLLAVGLIGWRFVKRYLGA